jgi:hypothetical protein
MRFPGEMDRWLFDRVATAHVPGADPALTRLSHSADHGRLWFGAPAGFAAFGGHTARRAALRGVGSLAIASLTVNTVVKWSAQRLARTRVVVSALAGALGRSRVYRAERVRTVGVEDLRGTETFAYDGEAVPADGALRLEKKPRALVVYRPAVPGDEFAQQARLAAAAARHRGGERGRRPPADGGPSAVDG